MYNSISIDEFGQKYKQEALEVIDVREVDEFASGHIPTAKNLPLSTLGANLDQLDKNKSYYIICQSGGRSAMACGALGNQGYNVTNVMGGMMSWRGERVNG